MPRFVGRRRPVPSGIVRRWSTARSIAPVNIIAVKSFREERRRRARVRGEEEGDEGGGENGEAEIHGGEGVGKGARERMRRTGRNIPQKFPD